MKKGAHENVPLNEYLFRRDGLSTSQKAIAEYLCENPWDGLNQTAAEIGAAVGVSASTVVRFAQSIGFNGLAELQKLLARHVKSMLRSQESIERVKFASEQLELERTESGYDVFLSVVAKEVENIERLRTIVSRDRFNEIVRQLLGAQHLYILGLRGSLSLAVHFTVGMSYVRPNVYRLDNSGDDLPDKLVSVGRDDCLVAFSYSPYTSTTVEAVKSCRQIGIPVVVVTDSERSPTIVHASHSLVTSNPLWFSSTTAGTTALINSLVYAAAAQSTSSTATHIAHAKRFLLALENFELSSMDNLLGILSGVPDE